MYSSILKDIEKFENEFIPNVSGYKREDYKTVLITEIRQTYYHTIETLFELIFALLPDSGNFYDNIIQYRLSNSNWRKNYNCIEKIAENIKELEFLDSKVKISQDTEVTKGHYLFYYGVNKENQKIEKGLIESIPHSLIHIKKGIQYLAKDFTQREEYNSYKHGLRLVPALKNIYLFDKKTRTEVGKFDLSNSMTFMTIDKKDESITYTTKNIDTWRDIEFSKFALYLISNIINLRRASLKVGKEKFRIYTFPNDNFEKMDKGDTSFKQFSYQIKNNNAT